MTVLHAVPEILQELGVDPASVLAAAGLDPKKLRDPESTISFAAMGRLLTRCVALTRCPHFGLLVGSREGLSALGMVGFLVQHSPDVGTGLRNLVGYIHHFQRGAVTTLSTDGEVTQLGFRIYQRGVESADQISDGALAVCANILRSLCGPGWRPAEVAFAHGEPEDLRPYKRVFASPLRFDAEESCISFPTRWLAQAVPGAEPMLYRILQRQAAQLDATHGSGFAAVLRGVIRTLLVSRRCSANDAAAVFGIHRRTLHRHLKAEGVTFDALVEEVRAELAQELLSARQTPLAQVASTLGYADVSAFSRAFRRWFGTTPARWRIETAQRE